MQRKAGLLNFEQRLNSCLCFLFHLKFQVPLRKMTCQEKRNTSKLRNSISSGSQQTLPSTDCNWADGVLVKSDLLAAAQRKCIAAVSTSSSNFPRLSLILIFAFKVPGQNESILSSTAFPPQVHYRRQFPKCLYRRQARFRPRSKTCLKTDNRRNIRS